MDDEIKFNLRMSGLDGDRLKALAKFRNWTMSHVVRDLIRGEYEALLKQEANIDNVY